MKFDAIKSTNIKIVWTPEDNMFDMNIKEEEEEDDEENGHPPSRKDNNNNSNGSDSIEYDKFAFHPDFNHQIFKDDKIEGFEPLRLNIYMGAGSLYTLIDTNYSSNTKNITNVEKELLKVLSKSDPPTTSKDAFKKYIEENEKQFKPPGKIVCEYNFTTREGEEKSYEIYFGRITDDYVLRYHERLQPFVLWFIDGSNFIHTSEDNWDIFFIFETRVINGEKRYGIAGYCTIYNFYHHPEGTRPRISQFLILPPYQRQRLGDKLLNSIYNYYKSNFSLYGPVYDITVEDPADQFKLLRNYVDLKNILDAKLFDNAPKELTSNSNTKELFENIRKQLLIPNSQAKVCLQIYIYRQFINQPKSNPKYKEFRISMKKKIYKQFIGNPTQADTEKQAEEHKVDVKTIEKERLETILDLYNQLEEDYHQTLSSVGII
eukprot:gene382-480_t